MDILQKVIRGQNCTADGATAGANPITNLMDNMMESKSAALETFLPPEQMRNSNAMNTRLHAVEESFHQAQEQHMSQVYPQQYPQRRRPPSPQHLVHPPLHHHQYPHLEGKEVAATSDSWTDEFLLHPTTSKLPAGHPSTDISHQQRSNHEEAIWREKEHAWRNEYQEQQHSVSHHNHQSSFPWVHEYQVQDSLPTLEQPTQASSSSTAALAQMMERQSDPRWQQSSFLHYMKQDMNQDMASQDISSQEHMMKQVWEETKADTTNDKPLDSIWNQTMAEIEHKLSIEEQVWNEGIVDQLPCDASSSTGPYIFQSHNPYSSEELDSRLFPQGLALFQSGDIDRAILVFEAILAKSSKQERNQNAISTISETWRMLGECHSEHDQDKQAIECFTHAVENDAYNLEALLSLGVSYVNELDLERALATLKTWITHHPKFQGLELRDRVNHLGFYSDGSLMDEVMELMIEAETHDPLDMDVQTVLGVVYNVSRDYAAATRCFERILNHNSRDDDIHMSSVYPYSIWNKLGATLANSNESQAAIPAYHHALKIKPKYARGWLNLGISHANLGEYHNASRCYFQALTLNPTAVHIWSYVRIAFTCMDRDDLVAAVATQDLDVFRDEFQFMTFN